MFRELAISIPSPQRTRMGTRRSHVPVFLIELGSFFILAYQANSAAREMQMIMHAC